MIKIKLLAIFVPLIFFLGCSSMEMKGKNQKRAGAMKTNPTKASQIVSADFGLTQCTLKKDIRTIAVNKTDSGCVVNYTKFGETKEIASGRQGYHHCQAVKNKVVTNLTEGGFSCNK